MGDAASVQSPNLYGFERAELGRFVSSLGAPPFHGGQIYRWLYGRNLLDPAGWTDLSRDLRRRLAETCRFDPGRITDRTEAADRTVKYRIALPEGGDVEAVAMLHRGKVTLCLSSQVGCALDCDFCLTGRMGLLRHMTTGEIVGQVTLIHAERGLNDPFNVVFMGMGEPLHNFDALLAAFRVLTDPDGFGLSRRRITVSTAGLAPAIERLAKEPKRPRLAVSLNAATDALRDRLMPINRRYPLKRLLDACRFFASATGETFTFEYVLIAEVNDSEPEVDRLARVVRAHRPAKLNLIPFNEVPGQLPYRAPSRERIVALRDRLLRQRVPVSVRWSRGAEARAACGQLALLPGKPDAPRRRRKGERL